MFDAAEKRLAWTDRRQALLARNIANANTPGFAPQDVTPFSIAQPTSEAVQPLRTNTQHLVGTSLVIPDLVRTGRRLHATDKNAVTLDQQLTKIAETESTQALTVSIYKKYMSMFNIAAGRSS